MIYINDIPSFRDPETEKVTIDDRQTRIEVVGGVIVHDLGRIQLGSILSVVCMFTWEAYLRVESLWITGEKVTYTDMGGLTWQDMRLVFREIERDKNFPDHIKLTFELWRV